MSKADLRNNAYLKIWLKFVSRGQQKSEHMMKGQGLNKIEISEHMMKGQGLNKIEIKA